MGTAQPGHLNKKIVLASAIGNVIEWYDFALYGYMASIISKLFFPGGDPGAALLGAYGIFAAGFVMRPLGSGVFGWLGDTIGRSRVMRISVVLMMIPTFLLGVLPTYASVGLLAPALLIVIRLVQGLSVGGEFSSSVTYLVETAPSNERGVSGSWANIGSMVGMLLGSAVAAAVTTFLPSGTINSWGWRIPFLLGPVLGVFGLLLLRQLPKSPYFADHEKDKNRKSPLKQAFTGSRKQTTQGMLFASGYGAMFYIALVYLPTWLSQYAGVPLQRAMQLNTLATVLLVPLIPLAGWVSDRYFRRTRFVASALALISVTTLPFMLLMHPATIAKAAVMQICLALLLAVPLGSGPAMFVELFPTEDRLSGYSVSFNIGMGIIGGSTPMLVTWLINSTGIIVAPAVYMILWGTISIGTLLWMRDGSREPLR